jgi:hypothetical protein
MWGLDDKFNTHVRTVRHMFAQAGIASITGAPFYQSIQSNINSQQQHFVFSNTLVQHFLRFFDSCLHFLASTTVDVGQREQLPFARQIGFPYIPFPGRDWIIPNQMPEGCQNGPAWEEPEQQGSSGDEPLAAVIPPPSVDAEGDPLAMDVEPGIAGQPQEVPFPPAPPMLGSADVEMPHALGSARDLM